MLDYFTDLSKNTARTTNFFLDLSLQCRIDCFAFINAAAGKFVIMMCRDVQQRNQVSFP